MIFYLGRPHQLRVHCDHIGHRIVGDYMYSNRQDTLPYRMMLHALRLKFNELDILSKDPFTSDNDELWKVTDTINTYNSICTWESSFPWRLGNLTTVFHKFNNCLFFSLWRKIWLKEHGWIRWYKCPLIQS